jgi:hypothetical protein
MPILKRSKTLTAIAGLALQMRAHQFRRSAPPDDAVRNLTMPLILFQRDECHLCDEAVLVLVAARAGDFESRWIDADIELEQRYGLRVPVLRREHDGAELDWPFDAAAVREFVAG